MTRRLSLRAKLLAALLALSAIALAVTSFAAALGLRSDLLQRLDRQLRATSDRELDQDSRFSPDNPGGPGAGPPGGPAPAIGFYRRVSDQNGALTGAAEDHENATASNLPVLPALTAAKVAELGTKPFNVDAKDGGPGWRVLVAPRRAGEGSVTVALSLADVDGTVGAQEAESAAVAAGVLALLGVLGYLAIGQSLRHLMQVEATAEAIAAGDLTLRVPGEDDRTEVGRLAAAFNGMLTQIEAAFRDRERSEGNALASEERMRRFVADASHELRTPLTSIRGFAELYRQGAVADEASVQQAMRRIEQEATRMGLLVEDLLLLARLDAQRPIERRPVNLLDLAADAATDARAIAPDRPVRLQAGEGEPVVLGDDARLRQIVSNLVSNALTHTPPGTAVTIRTCVDADNAELSVTDDGPGLSPEQAERLFERFYRVDTARTRAQGGSGLGLSIVAALVAAHGGRVDVTTAPGEGARFTVVLPLLGRPAPAVVG